MKHVRLLSTVAATVLLSAGAAFAQAPAKDTSPSPAPAAQQNAPAEKVAPNMKAGEKNAQTQKAPETTGQAPAASDAGKPRAMDKGAADKGAADKGAADKGPAKNPAESTTGQSTTPTSPNRAETPATAPKSGQSTTEQRSTTGQGAAAGAAKLSTEQRTQITSVFKQHRVEPAKLNVSVSVGTRVPNTVRFYPIPQDVVVIYPEWRGYNYILVGDQIVIIDPRTHEIVAVLEA
jgi:hypothetical protein